MLQSYDGKALLHQIVERDTENPIRLESIKLCLWLKMHASPGSDWRCNKTISKAFQLKNGFNADFSFKGLIYSSAIQQVPKSLIKIKLRVDFDVKLTCFILFFH